MAQNVFPFAQTLLLRNNTCGHRIMLLAQTAQHNTYIEKPPLTTFLIWVTRVTDCLWKLFLLRDHPDLRGRRLAIPDILTSIVDESRAFLSEFYLRFENTYTCDTETWPTDDGFRVSLRQLFRSFGDVCPTSKVDGENNKRFNLPTSAGRLTAKVVTCAWGRVENSGEVVHAVSVDMSSPSTWCRADSQQYFLHASYRYTSQIMWTSDLTTYRDDVDKSLANARKLMTTNPDLKQSIWYNVDTGGRRKVEDGDINSDKTATVTSRYSTISTPDTPRITPNHKIRLLIESLPHDISVELSSVQRHLEHCLHAQTKDWIMEMGQIQLRPSSPADATELYSFASWLHMDQSQTAKFPGGKTKTEPPFDVDKFLLVIRSWWLWVHNTLFNCIILDKDKNDLRCYEAHSVAVFVRQLPQCRLSTGDVANIGSIRPQPLTWVELINVLTDMQDIVCTTSISERSLHLHLNADTTTTNPSTPTTAHRQRTFRPQHTLPQTRHAFKRQIRTNAHCVRILALVHDVLGVDLADTLNLKSTIATTATPRMTGRLRQTLQPSTHHALHAALLSWGIQATEVLFNNCNRSKPSKRHIFLRGPDPYLRFKLRVDPEVL